MNRDVFTLAFKKPSGERDKNGSGQLKLLNMTGDINVNLRYLVLTLCDPRMKNYRGLAYGRITVPLPAIEKTKLMRRMRDSSSYAKEGTASEVFCVGLEPSVTITAALVFNGIANATGLTYFGMTHVKLLGFKDVHIVDPQTAPWWQLEMVMAELGIVGIRDGVKLRTSFCTKIKQLINKATKRTPAWRLLENRTVLDELAAHNGPFPGRYIDLINLSKEELQKLLITLHSDPYKLCFREFSQGATPAEYDNIIARLKKPEEWHRKTLAIYETVRALAYGGDGDSYTPVSAGNKFPPEGERYLRDNRIISEMGDVICLESVYRIEKEIAEGVICLIREFNMLEKRDPVSAPDDFCSEQLAAWKALEECPIVLIDGTAGSGKTRFLTGLGTGAFGTPLAVTFQGVNSGPLSRSFSNKLQVGSSSSSSSAPLSTSSSSTSSQAQGSVLFTKTTAKTSSSVGGAHTCHHVIFGHAGAHYKRGRLDETAECMMRDVDVLVVDEAANVTEDLLAFVFSAWMRCSRSRRKRLVMVGDSNQLGAFGLVSAFMPLRKYLERVMPAAVKLFLHNHRAGDDSLVCKNARRLLECAEIAAQHVPSPLVFTWTAGVFDYIPPNGNCVAAVERYLRSKRETVDERSLMVLARTHALKDSLQKMLETVFAEFTGTSGFPNKLNSWAGLNKGRKFCFARNTEQLEPGSVKTVNNEPLMLDWIYDVPARLVPGCLANPDIPHSGAEYAKSQFNTEEREVVKCKPKTRKRSRKPVVARAACTDNDKYWIEQGDELIRLIYFSSLDGGIKKVCTWDYAKSVGVKRASVMTVKQLTIVLVN